LLQVSVELARRLGWDRGRVVTEQIRARTSEVARAVSIIASCRAGYRTPITASFLLMLIPW
jgi:hypothetical protein